jgi:hypothetical protein
MCLRLSRPRGVRPHAVPQNPPPEAPLCTADLYDPRTNSWSATGTMSIGRFGHTATLLASGKVLVAGDSSCNDSGCKTTASAELYDPRSGHWSRTGSMHAARSGHTAVRLADRRVLPVRRRHRAHSSHIRRGDKDRRALAPHEYGNAPSHDER